jgi:chaperonin cofactor prefoldin
MTAVQLNAEILRNLGALAEDENMLKRVAKYLRKLVAEKEDATLMTEEEFFAKIERAEKQPGKSFESVDELDKYIRSL